MLDPQQLHHLLPEVDSFQGPGGVTSAVLQAGAPGNLPHGLPGAVSVPEPCPRWSRAAAVATALVSTGAGEELDLGRKGSWQEVVAPQGHGWLLRIVRA